MWVWVGEIVEGQDNKTFIQLIVSTIHNLLSQINIRYSTGFSAIQGQMGLLPMNQIGKTGADVVKKF